MTNQTITVPDGTLLSQEPLVGIDGNAFSIIGTVQRGLRNAGNPKDIIDSFCEQAMSGDYIHVIAVATAFTDPDPDRIAGDDDETWDDEEDDLTYLWNHEEPAR